MDSLTQLEPMLDLPRENFRILPATATVVEDLQRSGQDKVEDVRESLTEVGATVGKFREAS